jgi:hypothetical protein
LRPSFILGSLTLAIAALSRAQLAERAMSSYFASVAKSTLVAILICGVGVPCFASEATTRLAAEKLDPNKFEQKLQDTRDNIVKERPNVSPTDASGTSRIGVDICKKNPQLPQCKL